MEFIRYIVYTIQSFRGIITGWYLSKSDLVILDEVCKHMKWDHQLDSLKYLLLFLRNVKKTKMTRAISNDNLPLEEDESKWDPIWHLPF